MRNNKTGDAAILYKSSYKGLLHHLIFAVVTCLGIIGCQGGGAPGAIHFSPDGSIVAYTYVKRIDLLSLRKCRRFIPPFIYNGALQIN